MASSTYIFIMSIFVVFIAIVVYIIIIRCYEFEALNNYNTWEAAIYSSINLSMQIFGVVIPLHINQNNDTIIII